MKIDIKNITKSLTNKQARRKLLQQNYPTALKPSNKYYQNKIKSFSSRVHGNKSCGLKRVNNGEIYEYEYKGITTNFLINTNTKE
jgi:hypothetical protein